MRKTRTTGGAIFAVAAALYLAAGLEPGDIRETPAQPETERDASARGGMRTSDDPPAIEQPVNDANRQAAANENRPQAEPQFEFAFAAGRDPDFAAGGGWLSYLYPELTEIAETESLPAEQAFGKLQPLLDDQDPVVRLAALRALADLGRQAPLAALTAALTDSEPQIRIAALNALALRRDSTATGSIEALAFDSDAEVRSAAIDALAVTGDRAAVHTLGALLGDPNPDVGRSAIGALGDIGGAAAIDYLRQARYHADSSIRASATAILHEEALSRD